MSSKFKEITFYNSEVDKNSPHTFIVNKDIISEVSPNPMEPDKCFVVFSYNSPYPPHAVTVLESYENMKKWLLEEDDNFVIDIKRDDDKPIECDISKAKEYREDILNNKREFKNNERNSMGCSESWYDPTYSIQKTFSEEEIKQMSDQEILDLVKLAQVIADGLY